MSGYVPPHRRNGASAGGGSDGGGGGGGGGGALLPLFGARAFLSRRARSSPDGSIHIHEPLTPYA
eukprot:6214583-Pleurochrysis_carterae.AAC.1